MIALSNFEFRLLRYFNVQTGEDPREKALASPSVPVRVAIRNKPLNFAID
jgi:hypothetical protein